MGGGIYIHVPFCIRKCPYCSFYSVKTDEKSMSDYVDKTLYFLNSRKWNFKADTIYFGGGTPSVLSPNALVKILKKTKEVFSFEKGEVTLEANPCTVDYKSLKILHDGGFNRLSMGFQSGNDDELKMLGRLHDKERAKQAFYDARRAGFENISLDIMMGLAGQSIEAAEKSAEEIMSLNPNHISAYMLKIEKGTEFYNRYKVTEEFEDNQSDIYMRLCELFEENGYHQYEISNFSKDGFESRHNTKYWQLDDYWGIGPSAHSKIGKKRFYMPPSLNDYLNADKIENLLLYESESENFEEYVMLGLRLKSGINLMKLEKKYPGTSSDFENKMSEFIKYGYAEKHDNVINLTTKGFLISNYIISEVI